MHIPFKDLFSFPFFSFFLKFLYSKKCEGHVFNEVGTAVKFFCVIFQILFVLEETVYTFPHKYTFQISLCTYNILSLVCESRTILPSHLIAAEICHYVQKQHLEHRTKNTSCRFKILNENKHITLQSELSAFL